MSNHGAGLVEDVLYTAWALPTPDASQYHYNLPCSVTPCLKSGLSDVVQVGVNFSGSGDSEPKVCYISTKPRPTGPTIQPGRYSPKPLMYLRLSQVLGLLETGLPDKLARD